MSAFKSIIAIDPGASGAIAFDNGLEPAVAFKMPETPADIRDLILSFDKIGKLEGMVCYIERVGGYIGGTGAPGSSMFNFGEGFGVIQGILCALYIPYVLVRPQRWQSGLGLKKPYMQRCAQECMTEDIRVRLRRQNYEVNRDWKNSLKTTAQRMFPNIKVTLDNADALLILIYARRQELYQPARDVPVAAPANIFNPPKPVNQDSKTPLLL